MQTLKTDPRLPFQIYWISASGSGILHPILIIYMRFLFYCKKKKKKRGGIDLCAWEKHELDVSERPGETVHVVQAVVRNWTACLLGPTYM